MKNFISLLLDTTDSGNTVFLKEKKGREYIYLASEYTANGSSNLRRMTKEEVIANKDFLTNVGVSGNRIYPVTDLKYRKRLPEGMVRCGACGEVVWENNSYSFHKGGTDDDITICEKCDKYGHDGYQSCRGCCIPCWKKSNELYEVAGSGHSDFENLVCDEFLSNYNYCENCEIYYYHQDNNECPRCGK